MADRYIFLNVGCADCTILELGSKVVMVDCKQGDVDAGEEDIIAQLQSDKIDLLILTHPHRDHFTGIQTLLDNDITFSEIWGSPYKRRRGDNSLPLDEWNEYVAFVNKLKEQGAKSYTPYASSSVYDTIGGAKFYIFAPYRGINNHETREVHDGNLIVKMVKGNNSILFGGDASDYAWDKAREKYSLSCHILHASHHGSINGANLEAIKEASPNYTIISTKSGVYDNVPSETALQRYRRYTKKAVRRTDIDGTRRF